MLNGRHDQASGVQAADKASEQTSDALARALEALRSNDPARARPDRQGAQSWQRQLMEVDASGIPGLLYRFGVMPIAA
jgi:hypothetical protein